MSQVPSSPRTVGGALRCFAALCLLAPPGHGQSDPSVPRGEPGRSREGGRGKSVRAVRVEEAPVVDGRLDDDVWEQASRGGPLTQVMPDEGAAATERTEFRVVHDDDALYIGVWCFDGEPSKIVASEMARDLRVRWDDHIVLVLDPFLDRRNGYLFRVNPNGARDDALISNNVRVNENWDGIWSARSSIDGSGWYAEVAIPFTTLAFDPAGTAWGFNVERAIRRKDEVDRWSGARQKFRIQDVAEAGGLTGLEGLHQGIGLEVTPYALGKYRDDRVADDADTLVDGGLDLRYSIAPNLNAGLSYNTDFAETEVDARQVNLTRFPLLFPEKREFFLQDAGIFEFGDLGPSLIPFFSRRIGLSRSGEVVPITVAAKLTGRVGGYNIGLLDALVDEHAGLPVRNTFVGRVSRNVLESSSVGAIVTHGDPDSLDDNLLAGGDFVFRNSDLFEDWTLRGSAFALGTWTEGVRGGGNLAAGGSVTAESEPIFTRINVFQIDENVNPALGFVPRRDIRTYEGTFAYRPYVESVDWIRRFWVSYFTQHVTDLGNDLESALHSLTPIYLELESGDQVFFNTQAHLDAPEKDFEIHPGVIIPPDDYWWQVYRLGFQTANRRPVDGRFIYEFGQFYDGKKYSYDVEVTFKPSKHLFFALGYQLNQIRLPQGDFDTRLAFARAQVNFTTDLAWFNLLQYDDGSETIGLNSRLQWEFRPGSFLYLVLNQNVDRNHGRVRVEETELTAKLSMAFRF